MCTVFRVGDYLPMRTPYLSDDRFSFVTDADELAAIALAFTVWPPYVSGALVEVGDGEYREVWVTDYRAPWAGGARYTRLQ